MEVLKTGTTTLGITAGNYVIRIKPVKNRPSFA